MQTFTMLKSLPSRSLVARVQAHPATKRALHAAPVLRRQVKAQAQGEEGSKGEGAEVPARREEQGAAITSSPLSLFPSTSLFPMGGRLGSIFREMEEEMNAMTRAFGLSPFETHMALPEVPRGAKALACDIQDKGDHIEVHADVPGMSQKDLKITVSPDKVLSISGERKMEKKEEDNEGQVYRVERSYGSFMRRFKLPENVDVEGIKAETKDGVLCLSIPKVESPEPKVINVKVSESS